MDFDKLYLDSLADLVYFEACFGEALKKNDANKPIWDSGVREFRKRLRIGRHRNETNSIMLTTVVMLQFRFPVFSEFNNSTAYQNA